MINHSILNHNHDPINHMFKMKDELAKKIYQLEFPYDEEIHKRILKRDNINKKIEFDIELDCKPYSCFITAQFAHISRTLYLQFVTKFDEDEYRKVLEKSLRKNNNYDQYIIIYRELFINEGLIDIFNKNNKIHIYNEEEFNDYIS